MKDKPHPLADTEPMEAKLVDELPADGGWQYEPKWDGFRAIASRLGKHVELRSKAGKSLARYFPEIVAALLETKSDDYVVDGELILPIDGVLSFDALQARLHPAESRIRKLSAETPAQLMLFDCLAIAADVLVDRSLAERRKALELFHAAEGTATLLLSPHARDLAGAQAWLAASGGALDGVIAKPLSEPYRAGERAMLKVKQHRTADCVVGGFPLTKDGNLVASLLLGLYDDADLLNHVGFTSALAKQDRAELTERLKALISPLARDWEMTASRQSDRAWVIATSPELRMRLRALCRPLESTRNSSYRAFGNVSLPAQRFSYVFHTMHHVSS